MVNLFWGIDLKYEIRLKVHLGRRSGYYTPLHIRRSLHRFSTCLFDVRGYNFSKNNLWEIGEDYE
jgi:hypothetical protein